jgi:hypothetical protein
VPSYRLYRIDGAGSITSAEWIEAADDEEVARLAREQVPQGLAEIWQRNRLVARLGPGEESPID